MASPAFFLTGDTHETTLKALSKGQLLHSTHSPYIVEYVISYNFKQDPLIFELVNFSVRSV